MLRLLIHHHTIAFNENGKIWVQSFIGQWVEHLSMYFKQVDLLLYTSKVKMEKQDYCISQGNVGLKPLGQTTKGHWIRKTRELKSTCKELNNNYNCLLIRGITPRQMIIYKNCTIPYKAYLLVGSIRDNRPKFGVRKNTFISWILHKKRLYELREISKNALMLANSPGLAKELMQIYHVEAHFTPTNTIGLNHFSPNVFKELKEPLKLLFCGRVVKDKGIEDLLLAIRILNERGVKCELDVVGEIDQKYRKELTGLAKRNDIDEQICYSDFVPFGTQLLDHYRHAHIFILPSWHEGFPHAIWEAAATCTPIVTTPVGGIPDMISEKEVYFVLPRSPNSIADSIQLIISNENEVKVKIKNAQNIAKQFTSDRCAFIMAEVLIGILHE